MPQAVDFLTPRILVVDDERQIHASLRLRLGKTYDLVFSFDAKDALKKLQAEHFDLCFADIHMPGMDGLSFIEVARKSDPQLGFVVLSAFDTDINLRRAIPLQVYDFISKPLPEREGFEGRIPTWINETRERRRADSLARGAQTIANDRDAARLERDVELVASETARDGLLQIASLLTTIQAHLVSATTTLSSRPRSDPVTIHLLRNLLEARKTADAAVTVADDFFGSGYGNRDTSPALVNEGVHHAVTIATRMTRAEADNKVVDFVPVDDRLPIQGISGIDFLLMIVPAIAAALATAQPNTTVAIRGEHFPRLETVLKDFRLRHCLWINRRSSIGSRTGISLTITARGSALTRLEIEAWLKGEHTPLASITPQGLLNGMQKCRGILGIVAAPEGEQFTVMLALPT